MTTATSLYGQSLYDLAAEEGLTEEILKQMEAVDDIFKANPDYITLLLEPSIPRRMALAIPHTIRPAIIPIARQA